MLKYLFLFAFITNVGLAYAQPANDDCINAVSITAGNTCVNTSGTNVGVVSTDFDPCAEINKRNVWYKFTATNANHIVQVTFGTMQLGIINAFANGCGTLTALGTSDFFSAVNTTGSAVDVPNNLCFGNQSARNGKGYAGLIAYLSGSSSYREYLQTQLSEPMQPGKRYILSMYVSLSDFSPIAIDNIGMALRVGATNLLQSTTLNFMPQVTSANNVFLTNKKDWVNISAVFIADQPYTHLIIGNFKNNTLTNTLMVSDTSQLLSGGTFAGCISTSLLAYYYIEDVMVSEITSTSGVCSTVLPLTILSFTGTIQNNKHVLQWKTANEVNTKHFEIEQSFDGRLFDKIGIVNAEGNGNNVYRFINAIKEKEVNYFYRLKMVEKDGRFTYSNIILLVHKSSKSLDIFPNPVKDILTISGLKQFGIIRIFNVEGKLMLQQNVSANTITIDMSAYAKGMYLLQYQNEGEVVNQKIMKQ